MAALLPSGLPSVPQPQLCSSPGRGGGRPDAGCGGLAELWAAAPGAVAVLDLLLRLHLVCALRCLLEHLRLQLAGRATATAAVTYRSVCQDTVSPIDYSSIGRCLTSWLDEIWTVSHHPLPSRMEPDMQQRLLTLSSYLSQPACYLFRLSLTIVPTNRASKPPTALCLHFCWTFVSRVSASGTFVLTRLCWQMRSLGSNTTTWLNLLCLCRLNPTVPSRGDVGLMKVLFLHGCLLCRVTAVKPWSTNRNLNPVSDGERFLKIL